MGRSNVKNLRVLALPFVIVVCGCGGSKGSVEPPVEPPIDYSKANLTAGIYWYPGATRSIRTDALSIRIRVLRPDTGQLLFSQTVNRPSNTDLVQTKTFEYAVPKGELRTEFRAYDQLDGKGNMLSKTSRIEEYIPGSQNLRQVVIGDTGTVSVTSEPSGVVVFGSEVTDPNVSVLSADGSKQVLVDGLYEVQSNPPDYIAEGKFAQRGWGTIEITGPGLNYKKLVYSEGPLVADGVLNAPWPTDRSNQSRTCQGLGPQINQPQLDTVILNPSSTTPITMHAVGEEGQLIATAYESGEWSIRAFRSQGKVLLWNTKLGISDANAKRSVVIASNRKIYACVGNQLFAINSSTGAIENSVGAKGNVLATGNRIIAGFDVFDRDTLAGLDQFSLTYGNSDEIIGYFGGRLWSRRNYSSDPLNYSFRVMDSLGDHTMFAVNDRPVAVNESSVQVYAVRPTDTEESYSVPFNGILFATNYRNSTIIAVGLNSISFIKRSTRSVQTLSSVNLNSGKPVQGALSRDGTFYLLHTDASNVRRIKAFKVQDPQLVWDIAVDSNARGFVMDSAGNLMTGVNGGIQVIREAVQN